VGIYAGSRGDRPRKKTLIRRAFARHPLPQGRGRRENYSHGAILSSATISCTSNRGRTTAY
jgi:hypothetical protein